MKKIITLIGLAALLAGMTTGCVTKDKQVLEKSTVFGFQAKTPGGTGYSTTIQIGLVRSEYFSNPTSTNKVYSSQFSSHVDAKLSAISQSAKEDFSTLPQMVDNSESPTNVQVHVVTSPQQ